MAFQRMEDSTLSSSMYDSLSKNGEVFRSKLIEDFHLLDSFDDHGHSDAPKYYSKDFEDSAVLDKMMVENPNGLVKFQVYSTKDKLEIRASDRRKNRVKNKNSKNPPLDMWAHFILESSVFQNFMLFLILTNSIALGVQAEFSSNSNPKYFWLRIFLDLFDYCSLFLFMVEIILKWIDDFFIFWKNGWNIFDFAVTVGSFIPEVIAMTAQDMKEVQIIIRNLRVFRILRSLKMVTRFKQVRLIALATTKAFSAMTFIMLLLFTFLYIFAIVGIIFFDEYSRSQRDDLNYQDSFSTIGRAMITLIQLFTLDQWYKLLKDMEKVTDTFLTYSYVMLWIMIGSFIFKNIFVGIMVNNFQSIRNDLFDEVKEQEFVRKMAQDAELLNEELTRQDRKLNTRRRTAFDLKKNLPGITEDDESRRLSVNPNYVEELPVITEDDSSDENGEMDETDKEEKTEQIDESLEHEDDDGASLGSSCSFDFSPDMSCEDIFRRISDKMLDAEKTSVHWEKTVHDNLRLLNNTPSETLWPRDTLFKYFQIMEALQENLQERYDLQTLTYQALIQVFDSHEVD